MARALSELAGDMRNTGLRPEYREILKLYLKVIDVDCDGPGEGAYLACLSGEDADSYDDLEERLAIARMGNIFKRAGFLRARLKILSLADLSDHDPLSEDIYADRVSACIENADNAQLLKLASMYTDLGGAMTELARARAFYRTGNKNAAYRHFIHAAGETRIDWILRAIYTDLRQYYPEIFTPAGFANLETSRYLVFFLPYLNPVEIRLLKQHLAPSALLSSASPATIYADGYFLIKTDQVSALEAVALGSYTYLSQNPDILYVWTELLFRSRQYRMLAFLFERFAHVKPAHQGFWKMQIEFLENSGNKDAYFNEVVEYLKVFHSDYGVSDRLIQFLIGANPNAIHWAEDRYWQSALANLPSLPPRGRFIYWLKRYYEAAGKHKEAQEVKENFYALAPGSYYARAFWDELPAGPYDTDWRNVRDRASYLRWIARHGGNEQAVRFLAGRETARYLDPAAINLLRRISSSYYRIPAEVIELYELGEYNLGNDFFRDAFFGKVSQLEYVARLVFLGRRTGNLNLSVYYTRQLAREMNIAEDPFSMPEGLLKELYPRPYLPEVRRYSQAYGIQEEMVYALMRQESMFKEIAISRSGAQGLMQIMPATGRELARGLQIRGANLMDPETSIQMGAKFFSDLMRSYSGDFRWSAIAYNGGPGNLARWKFSFYRGDFNAFLESLPATEPRDYCRVTYQNYQHYRTLYLLHP